MFNFKWSASEKKVARRAYEHALSSRLAKLLVEFKSKAAAAVTPSDMWDVEEFLRRQRREIDEIFDYRYSWLPVVFARLIRDGDLNEEALGDLSEEKLEAIRRLLSF